ncbi:tetratricopeptide repeat protein, partial [bacterium]|nr:tetratricopeptide repeat protein [bacterium]
VPEENIPDIKEQKDEKIKNLSFIFEEDEFGVLDKIADSIKNFLSFSDKRSQEDKEENKLSLTELMNKAKQEETNFDYKHAISLYLKALALKNDEDYYTYLPSIYNKLGFNYQNLSNWYDAQKYFEMAEDFYNSTGDIEKINETRYNIANIFYMTFKRDKAKTILNEILKEITSDELKVKTYNFLANLTSNANIAYEYYKKALEINPLNISKNVLSELYYKFALTNEDIGDEETAVLFYKKCITLDAKNNPHISDALSNLALLYDDIGERDLAIKYYLESLKIDEVNKNFNGIYSSSMKLGEIYSVKQPEKALEYFNKALDYANKLNEDFYIISTNTALGDFYFNKKNNETALRHFKIAYKHASNSTYTENAEKIQLRINDIKIKIGEERFNELEK